MKTLWLLSCTLLMCFVEFGIAQNRCGAFGVREDSFYFVRDKKVISYQKGVLAELELEKSELGPVTLISGTQAGGTLILVAKEAIGVISEVGKGWQLKKDFSLPSEGQITLSTNNQKFFSYVVDSATDGKRSSMLNLVDLESFKRVMRLKSRTGVEYSCVTFSMDEKLMAVGDSKGGIAVFATKDFESPIGIISNLGNIAAIAISNDSLTAMDSKGRIARYSRKDAEFDLMFEGAFTTKGKLTHVIVSGDGRRAAYLEDGCKLNLAMIEKGVGKAVTAIDGDRKISNIFFLTSNGKALLVQYQGGELCTVSEKDSQFEVKAIPFSK